MANPVNERTWIVDNLFVNSSLTLGAGGTALNFVFGATTLTAPLSLPSGTAAAPSLTFTGDTSTGLFRNAANDVRITTGGTTRLAITSSAITVTGSTTLVVENDLQISGRLVFAAAASKIVPGATSISLRNNADTADNLLITDAGNATIRNNLVVSGTGPHAIGGATAAATQINIQGAFTATGGAGNAFGLEFGSSIIVQANQDAALFDIDGTLVEAGSGTHGTFSGIRLNIQETLAAAAVTDFAAIRVLAGSALDAGVTTASGIKINAPTGATNNFALWVAAGTSRLDGVLALGTSTITNAVAGQAVMLGVAFASLPAAVDGTLTYCNNCAPASAVDQTCAGASTGSLAFRVNGAWKCIS